MKTHEKANEIINAVKIMRELQCEFFANRDRNILAKSKKQEKIVDKLIEEWNSNQIGMFN